MDIKDMLIKLRLENKMTQKEIAGLLNMSSTGYASWEQGLAKPNIDAIKKLCKMYEISTDILLGLEDY